MKYIGEVSDEDYPWFDGNSISWSDVQDRHPWQKNRVYQDELNYFNDLSNYWLDFGRMRLKTLGNPFCPTSEVKNGN